MSNELNDFINGMSFRDVSNEGSVKVAQALDHLSEEALLELAGYKEASADRATTQVAVVRAMLQKRAFRLPSKITAELAGKKTIKQGLKLRSKLKPRVAVDAIKRQLAASAG